MRMQFITAALLIAPLAATSLAAQDTTQSKTRDTTSQQQNQYGNQSNQNQSRNQWNQEPQSDEAIVMRIHRTNMMEIRVAQLAQRNSSSAKVKSYAARLVKDHQAADRKLSTVAKKMGIALTMNDSSWQGQGHDGMGRYGQSGDSAQRGDSMSHPTDRDGYPRSYGDSTQRDSTNRQGQGQYQGQGQGTYPQRNDSAMMQQGDSMKRQGDGRAELQKLEGLRGAEFDAAFASAMVQGHQKAIAMLESAQGKSQSQYKSNDQSQNQSETSPMQSQYRVQSGDLKAFITSTLPTLRRHLQLAQSLTTTSTTTTSSNQQ